MCRSLQGIGNGCARQGVEIEREPVQVTLNTELMDYTYPHLGIQVSCSKGTYLRSIAHDLGTLLGSGAHLSSLIRTRSGNFSLADCLDGEALFKAPLPEAKRLTLTHLRRV